MVLGRFKFSLKMYENPALKKIIFPISQKSITVFIKLSLLIDAGKQPDVSLLTPYRMTIVNRYRSIHKMIGKPFRRTVVPSGIIFGNIVK